MSDSPVVQEWVDQGQVKNARAFIIQALRVRFKTTPADLIESIQQTTSLDTLNNWHNLALIASSIDDVRAIINPEKTKGPNGS